MVTLSIRHAVVSLLGKREEPGYVDVGMHYPINELRKLIGLKATPMLYNYISGKTQEIEPERAKVFLEKFDILINQWNSPEELLADCVNNKRAMEIAYIPIEDIMKELVNISQIEHENKLRRSLLGLIAKYY